VPCEQRGCPADSPKVQKATSPGIDSTTAGLPTGSEALAVTQLKLESKIKIMDKLIRRSSEWYISIASRITNSPKFKLISKVAVSNVKSGPNVVPRLSEFPHPVQE
jgi:hypothetical protein